MIGKSNKSSYGPRYWLLEKFPAGVSAWVFKGNRVAGDQAFHSLQPNPSGLTLRIISAGEWTVKMNNREMQAGPGDIFGAYPDILIEFFSSSSSWEWYEIQLNGSEARAFLSSFGCTEKKAVFSPENRIEALKIFKQIYEYMDVDERSVWKMQSLVYSLLDACNPSLLPPQAKKSSRESLIDLVIDLIETVPAVRMNISELAEATNVDRTTLRRAFQEQMKMNPIDFIKKIRIERAMELLLMTDRPLTAIAQATGFSNVKYFSRCFKETAGFPPRKWKIIRKKTHS